jgi:hypothetical protein
MNTNIIHFLFDFQFMQSKPTYKTYGDKIAIMSSFICAVHCVLLPVFFTTLPLLGIEILKNNYIEALTILVSMTVGGWAIWRGYRLHHHNQRILFAFLVGLSCMLVSNFLLQGLAEIIAKAVGGTIIITAHIQNWRKCKHCSDSVERNRLVQS